MGTVLRAHGWNFVIYTDDHPPPHVHGKGNGGEAKVSLPEPGQPVQVLRVALLTTGEAMRAVRLVEEHRATLLASWRTIHG